MSAWRFACSFVILLAAAAATGGEPPAASPRRVAVAPKIDGRLDDACWRGAPTIAQLTPVRALARGVPRTHVWIARDAHALYFAFRCFDPDPRAIQPKVKRRDGPAHTDDAVEVFVDPGSNGRFYYHFVVDAANVQADQEVYRGQRRRDWDAAWKSATRIDDQGWTAELAIPFAAVLERGAWGRPWRLNVARDLRRPPGGWACWAPVERTYHEPRRFGVLRGTEKIRAVFAPRIERAEVSGYQTLGEGLGYTVTALVRNDSGRAGLATLVVRDRPAGGPATEARATASLASIETRRVEIRVPVRAPGDREVEVRLLVAGAQRQRCRVRDLDPLRPLDAYAARNYFTTEPAAQVACEISLPPLAGGRVQARIVPLQAPAEWRRTVNLTRGRSLIDLPLSNAKPGAYRVAVELLMDGRVVSRRGAEVVKRRPGPTTEVKIDRFHRAVLVNGEPFFPFALYWREETPLSEVARCGFNAVCCWRYRAEPSTELLDAAAAAGLRVIEPPHRFYPKPLRYADPKFRERVEDFIQHVAPRAAATLASHPALVAYYSFDEPDCARPWLKGEGKTMPQFVAELYDAIHARDPYRPVMALFSMALPTADEWWRGFDFGGVDYYPSVGGDRGLRSSVLYVARGTIDTVAAADTHRAPAWLVINAEMFSGSVRPMTPAEQRCQTYLALIYRAKGLIYFVGPLRHVATRAVFKQLGAEVRRLAPALLQREPRQQVDVRPAAARDAYGFPPLHARFKRFPDGRVLLLAANSQPDAVAVRFELPQAKTVRGFFDGKLRRLRAHAFAERIEGFGTRAFEVRGLPSRGALRLTVRVSGPAVERLVKLAETERGGAEEAAGPNLLTNPKLENAKGWQFIDWSPKGFRARLTFEPSGRPGGGRCARIDQPSVKSVSQLVSDWIELKPHTEYRYGGWVRAEITEGRRAVRVMLLDEKNKLVAWTKRLSNGQLYARFVRVPAGQREWKLFSDSVVIGDRPRRVRLWCRVIHGAGRVWFDDMFVRKSRVVRPERKKRNLLCNSSFERAALPGWPDHWNGSLNAGPPMGAPGARWMQAGDAAFHGRCCVRVVLPPGLKKWEYGRTYYMPNPGGVQVTPDRPYTLSVYLKGDRPGLRVRLSVSYLNRQGRYAGARRNVTITNKWARYSMTFTPTNMRSDCKLAPAFKLLDAGTLWIDAVQLEAGAAATPYEENGE